MGWLLLYKVYAGTFLCICRDPSELNLLKEKGIRVDNGSQWMRWFAALDVAPSRWSRYRVDYLDLLNGSLVAGEIKKCRPGLPIVMVADHLGLPEGALESVECSRREIRWSSPSMGGGPLFTGNKARPRTQRALRQSSR